MSAQAMEALAVANHIRIEGARIRREMGQLDSVESLRRAAEILQDPPEVISRMRLGHFLRGIKRVSDARVRSFMRAAALPLSGEEWVVGPCERNSDRRPLTERQRLSLAAVLEKVAEGMS